jgi:uncharacterized membrane protein YfcA
MRTTPFRQEALEPRSAPGLVARLKAAGVSGTLSSPLLTQASLIALSVWAIVGLADIAGAIAESRQGAWITIATAAVVLVSALVSSIAGFAFSALAGSALAYFNLDPVSAVRTIVLCSCAIQFYCVWKLRSSIRWGPLWPLLASGTLTIPLGVWLLVRLDASFYAAGLGLLLIGYSTYALMRREMHVVRGGAWTAVIAGVLGGLTGGLAGLPGPSVTIWCSMRGWDKLQQRAVYQPYILAMQLVTIACLRWQAPPSVQAAQDLVFVPFALFGAIGGLALFQRMTNKQFHVATSALLLASGVGLLVRTF